MKNDHRATLLVMASIKPVSQVELLRGVRFISATLWEMVDGDLDSMRRERSIHILTTGNKSLVTMGLKTESTV